MTLDQLASEVLKRLEQRNKKVFLIGACPCTDWKNDYVNLLCADIVIVGILSPAELLAMPTDSVCQALFEGKPVFLWMDQPHRKAKCGFKLKRLLDEKQNFLLELGLLPLYPCKGWFTVHDVEIRKRLNWQVPQSCRLTPLAKDFLEGWK